MSISPTAAKSISTAPPCASPDPLAARALGIGVVHQECLAFDNLSVAENHVRELPAGAPQRSVNWAAMRCVWRQPCCAISTRTSMPTCRPSRLEHRAEARDADRARAGPRIPRAHIPTEPTASLSRSAECVELFRIVHKLRDARLPLLFISHKVRGDLRARGSLCRVPRRCFGECGQGPAT